MNKKPLKWLVISGALLLVSQLASLQVDATESTAQVQINPGPLSIQTIENVNFGTITLNNQEQKLEASRDFKFIDHRGRSTTGWRLNVKRNAGIEDKGVKLNLQGTGINHQQASVTLESNFEVLTDNKTIASISGPTTDAYDYTLPIKHELVISKNAASGLAQVTLTWDLRAEP